MAIPADPSQRSLMTAQSPPVMPGFSEYGRLTDSTGIDLLMEDLGRAFTSDPDMRMLGGGNPAAIPAVQRLWRGRMEELMREGDRFERMLVNYDPPGGNPAFLSAVAQLLADEFGWPLTADHIAVTPGGQTGFFHLLNLFGGTPRTGGPARRIMLPIVPEYIGYAAQGLEPSFFTATRPEIEDSPDEHRFRYLIPFDRLQWDRPIGAVCLSRPTNPTGNVVSDSDLARLVELTRERGVPLLVDNAYGLPFPGAVFTDAKPLWDEHVILVLSLSKLGLPGTRTGIVVARPEIASAMRRITSVSALANNNIGQAMVLPMVESGEILKLARETVGPYYKDASQRAQQWLDEAMRENGVDYRIHYSDGAFFLWLWLPDLRVTTWEFYQRLKERKVLVVPGRFFSFGLDDPWDHPDQCLRISFAQPESVVREGLRIIAEEAAAYAAGGS